MDHYRNGVEFSQTGELTRNENFGDTTLRLNCLGYGENNTTGLGSKSNLQIDFSSALDDGCRLVLGLGPTPTTYCDDFYNTGVDKIKGQTNELPQGLVSEGDSILKLGPSGGARADLRELECSLSTETDINTPVPGQFSADENKLLIPVVDEGSTSAKKSGGYMPSLLLAPRMDGGKVSEQTQDLFQFRTKSYCHRSHLSDESSSHTDFSATVSEQTTTVAFSEHRTSITKRCEFPGCTKGARGASGLCIGHGGGQRCQKPGCNKVAESRTAFCKAHGGGRRCQHLGCTKSAEGKTDFCMAHGGGRRCQFPGGCNKAARSKSGLCIRHGGGKRCKMEGCTRSAEGQAGLCISHGGGRRCQYKGCTKGAQGSTMYCKAHGGGKRCIFSGCTKGAEGSTPLCKGHGGGKRCLFDGGGICPKSVHGGTNFCVAHGGGKRCIVPGCTKSARGRTDCCVRHGGGKRCKFVNCGKSAQSSTDFCKAHGGGKRCSWGEGKCEKFARGKGGLCAAHSSMVEEKQMNKGGLISPGLFHGLVSAATTATLSSFDNTYSTSGVSAVSDCIESPERPPERQQLIPPQVLVPLSMKLSTTSHSSFLRSEKHEEERNLFSGRSSRNLDWMIPEGRVHGGGLMSLLGESVKNPVGN